MTNPERYLLYLNPEELEALQFALLDATDLLGQKISDGEKYDDEDIALMRQSVASYAALSERLQKLAAKEETK